MTKTVLLLGSGGREHALAWKMAQSSDVGRIVVIPGSDGIASLEKITCVAGDMGDAAFVVAQAKAIAAALVVIGPEKPLANGVSDALEQAGFDVFAPSRAAAQLESSKIFSKNFMTACGIPTAGFDVCDNYNAALEKLAAWDIEGVGVVLKADGLAAGKGVVVTHDREEALKTAHDFMVNAQCTVKTEKLLLEQKITGREVSAFAFCDGKTFMTVGYACDYKRVNDGDKGPNTGGMGGYAPKGWPSETARKFIETHVFKKTIDGMAARGTPFKGILFAGLMIDGDDVKVIEFNTRFGDPEAQILLPTIASDIVPVFAAAAAGKLADAPPVSFTRDMSVHVVMVSEGYPENFGNGMRLGQNIDLPLGLNDNTLLFLAGARKKDGVWINDGGRVLGVTALGATLDEARKNAYDAVSKIHFNGAHWRKDIAAQ